MVNVVGIRFKKVGKTYYFDPGNLDIKQDMSVIVETARGVEMGEVVLNIREVPEADIVSPLKTVIRIATDEDRKQAEENKILEQKALSTCLKKIEKNELDMSLVFVEYTFDRNKIIFYFTADGRVDFRELVKDLASEFHVRIELRQIGVRDEAKFLGGLGICGRQLCCSAFLGDFEPVSIKMAKEQSLSLNPTKISGTCGRLLCCLKYEQDAYEDLLKITPPVESIVETPNGTGVVLYVNVLKGVCKVRLDKSADNAIKDFNASEIKVIKMPTRDNDKNLPMDLKNLE